MYLRIRNLPTSCMRIVFQSRKSALFLLLILCITPIQGFFTHSIIANALSRIPVTSNSCRNSGVVHTKLREKDDGNNDSFQEKLDTFLDTPFFDPEDESLLQEDESSGRISGFRSWFASLLKNDYETAEALYVALVFSILVVFSQELLRMQMYGNNYIPFTRFTSGKLW